MSIRKVSPTQEYYVGEIEFTGYDLHNIAADKTVVVSGNRIFRRIKDLIDLYSICIGDNIDIEAIYQIIEKKERKLDDFDALFNRKEEIEHAYKEIRRVEPKPELDVVYDVAVRYCEAFRNQNHDLEWNHNILDWEKKKQNL